MRGQHTGPLLAMTALLLLAGCLGGNGPGFEESGSANPPTGPNEDPVVIVDPPPPAGEPEPEPQPLFPAEVLVRSEAPGTGTPPAGAERCDPLDPNYCLFPFPNNYFTTADVQTDNRMRVNLNLLSMPRNVAGLPINPTDWNRNDGFSPGQPILAMIPGIDLAQTGAVPITNMEAALQDDAPIVLIDTLTLQKQLIWAELDANITPGMIPSPLANGAQGQVLAIRVGKNLVPGRRYIVAMRGLKDGQGQVIAPSPVFAAYRDGQPLANAAQEARRPLMEDIFNVLGLAGVGREDLNLAWDFTVASGRNLTERLVHMRDEALAITNNGSPGFTIDAVIDNPENGSASAITARRIRGHIDVPCFLNSPNCLSGGTMNYPLTSLLPGSSGAVALPQRNPLTPNARVPFICSIARKTMGDAENPAQATQAVPGRAALYGHGLLGSRDEGNTYDLNVREMAQRHNFVFCMVDWAGLAVGNLPDDQSDNRKYDPLWDAAGGDIVSTFLLLADFSGFNRLADRLQQGFLNFTMLGRAMISDNGLCTHPAFQVQGQCVIDRSNLFYDGNSQGGINGGPVTAISPDIEAATLGVPGMAYSTLLQRSVDFAPYAPVFYNSYPSALDQQFILSLIQMLWDRGENNGYAWSLAPGKALPGTKPDKRVMLIPAFADHQVYMNTAEIMARTIEAPLQCPAVVRGRDAQRGPAVMPKPHPAVVAEQEQFPNRSFGRRHPDEHPYFGLPCIPSYPFVGNALTVWDSGPMTNADGSPNPSGSAPPPLDNRPMADGYGADPHGHPRSEARNMDLKSQFLSTGGTFVDVCNGLPCTSRGFDPSLELAQ